MMQDAGSCLVAQFLCALFQRAPGVLSKFWDQLIVNFFDWVQPYWECFIKEKPPWTITGCWHIRGASQMMCEGSMYAVTLKFVWCAATNHSGMCMCANYRKNNVRVKTYLTNVEMFRIQQESVIRGKRAVVVCTWLCARPVASASFRQNTRNLDFCSTKRRRQWLGCAKNQQEFHQGVFISRQDSVYCESCSSWLTSPVLCQTPNSRVDPYSWPLSSRSSELPPHLEHNKWVAIQTGVKKHRTWTALDDASDPLHRMRTKCYFSEHNMGGISGDNSVRSNLFSAAWFWKVIFNTFGSKVCHFDAGKRVWRPKRKPTNAEQLAAKFWRQVGWFCCVFLSTRSEITEHSPCAMNHQFTSSGAWSACCFFPGKTVFVKAEGEWR